MRKQDVTPERPVRVAEGAGTVVTSVAERIPKPLVLAAFFGYFLSLLAESTPSETKQGVPCEGMRIATGAVRPRNDSF